MRSSVSVLAEMADDDEMISYTEVVSRLPRLTVSEPSTPQMPFTEAGMSSFSRFTSKSVLYKRMATPVVEETLSLEPSMRRFVL